MAINFTVNGKPASTEAPPQTPLLWVIREDLKLTGTKFGCGTGLRGACMVHIDGKRAFSCQTQVSEITGKSVTTIEGLSADSSHPVQKAGLAERVPQCGCKVSCAVLRRPVLTLLMTRQRQCRASADCSPQHRRPNCASILRPGDAQIESGRTRFTPCSPVVT